MYKNLEKLMGAPNQSMAPAVRCVEIVDLLVQGDRNESAVQYLVQHGTAHSMLIAHSLGLVDKGRWHQFMMRMDHKDADHVLSSPEVQEFPVEVHARAIELSVQKIHSS